MLQQQQQQQQQDATITRTPFPKCDWETAEKSKTSTTLIQLVLI